MFNSFENLAITKYSTISETEKRNWMKVEVGFWAG